MRWTHVFVFVMLIGVVAPAEAQTAVATPNRPDGWWGSVGGGISGLRFSCEDCPEEQPVHEAPAVVLNFGKTLGAKVALGVEFAGALPSINGNRVVASALTGVARWYPSSSPFYIKFGVGLSRARLILKSDGQTYDAIRNGSGISFGAGYDVRLSRAIALTPYAGWYMNAIGDIEAGAVTFSNVSWNTWSFGVGVTFF